MAKCVNIKHPDFNRLLQESGLDAMRLAGEIGAWMDKYNTDEWPSLDQLGIIPLDVVLPLPHFITNEMLKEHPEKKAYYGDVYTNSNNVVTWGLEDKYKLLPEDKSKRFTIVPGDKFKRKNYQPFTPAKAERLKAKITAENDGVSVFLKDTAVGNRNMKFVIAIYPVSEIDKLTNRSDRVFKKKRAITEKASPEDQRAIEDVVSIVRTNVDGKGINAFDLLDRILENNPHLHPDTDVILKQILKSKKRGFAPTVIFKDDFNNNDELMGILPSTSEIAINYSSIVNRRYRSFDDFANTFMHELVHGITVRALREDPVFYKKMNVLFQQFRTERRELVKAKQIKKTAWASNYKLEEFVSDLFTDPEVREGIMQIDGFYNRDNQNHKQSLLVRLINNIWQWFTGEDLIKIENQGVYRRSIDRVLRMTKSQSRFTTELGEMAYKRDRLTDRKRVKQIFNDLAEQIKEDQKTNTYNNVTGLIKNQKFAFSEEDSDNDQFSKSRDLGSFIHSKIKVSVDDLSKEIVSKMGLKMSPEAILSLKGILSQFDGENVTILSEVPVADFDYRIKGIIDLIIIDKDNRVHIYDFKVKEGGFKNYDKAFKESGLPTNPNDPAYKVPYSARQYAHLQLASYARLLFRSIGLSPDTMNVVMLKPDIFDNEIKDIALDTSFSETGIDTFTSPISGKDIDLVVPPRDMKDGKVRSKLDPIIDQEEDRTSAKDFSLAEEMPSMIQEVSDKIMDALKNKRDIIARISETRAELADKFLEDLLKEEDLNKRMITLIKQAYKSTKDRLDEYKHLKKEGKINIDLLADWRDYVSAYDSLDRYSTYLELESGTLIDEKTKKNYKELLDKTIKLKSDVKDLYRIEGRIALVDALSPYYHRIYAAAKLSHIKTYKKLKPEGISQDDFVNKMMFENERTLEQETKMTILKELDKASRDTNGFTRWLDNILDSRDPIISAMVTKFAMVHEQSRLQAKYMRDDLTAIVNELQEFQSQGLFTNMEDYYSFFIERDKDGKPTGHYITPFMSTLLEDYKKINILLGKYDRDKNRLLVEGLRKAWKDGLLSLTADGMLEVVQNELKEQEKLIKAGKESKLESLDIIKQFTLHGNAPLTDETKKRFKSDLDDAILQGVRADIISNQERIEIEVNANRPFQERLDYYQMADKGIIKEAAADYIKNWIYTNAWNYRVPSSNYYNPQWEALSKILADENDPRAKFYNFVVNMSRESDKKLYYRNRLGTRLPGVVKQLTERITEWQNPATVFKNSFGQALTLTEQDIDRGLNKVVDEQGKAKYFLPVHYTSKPDINDQSFDIPTIYMKFWHMANDHALKAEILPEMELVQYFLDERQSVVGTNKMGKEILSKSSNYANMYRDFMLMLVYGESKVTGKTIKVFGKVISTEKILDLINKYTALNLLGLNYMQGVANLILGESMQTIDAIAGEYVSMKSYNAARLEYDKNLPGMLDDIGREIPKNIISLIAEEFNVLHDSIDVKFRESSKFSRMMKSNTLLFQSRVGEHFMQVRFMIAYLKEQKAYNKKGEVVGSIYDYYTKDKEGNLVFDAENKLDLDKSKWNNKDKNYHKIRLKGILSRIHGEYGELGMIAAQRFALGRMGYMFRRFVIPGMKRRWEPYGYVERLQQFTEGDYITFYNFAKKMAKDWEIFKLSMWSENWNELTEHEQANVIRAIMEMSFLLSTILLTMLMVRMGDDDDEAMSSFQYFALYQMYRYRAELTFWVNPQSMIQILRSPAASMSTIENLGELFYQLFEPFEVYDRGPNKDTLKVWKEFRDLLPAYRQFHRWSTMSNTVNWFKN